MKHKFIIIVFSVLLAAFLVACGKSGEETGAASDKMTEESSIPVTDQTDDTADSEQTETEGHDDPFDSVETFNIPFAGLTLKYPAMWQDAVTVTETEDGALAFTVDGISLFTLYANAEHSILGTVKGEKYTVISVECGTGYDSSDDTFAAMQEDINVIISNLSKDYDFEIGVALEKEDDSVFEIETSVTTLYYPAKWKDRVTVDVEDTKVSFSCDGTPLFDLVFTESDDGYLLGTYSGTPINIVDYMVYDDTLAAMQEDVNVILQHLMEDENFVIHLN